MDHIHPKHSLVQLWEAYNIYLALLRYHTPSSQTKIPAIARVVFLPSKYPAHRFYTSIFAFIWCFVPFCKMNATFYFLRCTQYSHGIHYLVKTLPKKAYRGISHCAISKQASLGAEHSNGCIGRSQTKYFTS